MMHQSQGAVLVVALVFLVVLTILSLTTLSTTTLEEHMAANSHENSKGLQIADSGIQIMLNKALTYTNEPIAAITTHTYSDNTELVYQRDGGTESEVTRSANARGMWSKEQFSNYHYHLQSVATTPAGHSRQVDVGVIVAAASSDSN